MAAIFSRVRLNTRQVATMVVFVMLASLAQMIAPVLVSRMIDGVAGNAQNTIIVLAVAMIGLSLAACLTNVIATNLAAALTTRFSADLRRELFNKVQSFSAAEIDRFGTASLISRNTTDVTMIQTFLTMLFRIGVLTPMMAVIGLVLAIAFTGRLAIVLAIAVPVLIVVVGLILFNASRYSVKLRYMIDGINRLFLETLEGVRVIRAFNRQEHEISRFDKVNEESAEISRKSIAISEMMVPVVNSLFGLTSVGAIQDAMAVLMKGRTSFVIAHRLSTIRDANVILYMENGDIKEVGDHDALMELNGKYAALYNSQFA